jgi:hypothetical protein
MVVLYQLLCCSTCCLINFDRVNIREIGIRCDGVYMREDPDEELMQRQKCGSVLKWYESRQHCENGKSLDTILAMDYSTPQLPIKFVVFVLEGSNFELDVRGWKPLSKHVGYHTLPTTPRRSAGYVHNMEHVDESMPSIPFKRVALQVRTTKEEFGKIESDLVRISEIHPVSEAGEVLADALKFSVLHNEESVDDRMTELQVFAFGWRACLLNNIVLTEVSEFTVSAL